MIQSRRKESNNSFDIAGTYRIADLGEAAAGEGVEEEEEKENEGGAKAEGGTRVEGGEGEEGEEERITEQRAVPTVRSKARERVSCSVVRIMSRMEVGVAERRVAERGGAERRM